MSGRCCVKGRGVYAGDGFVKLLYFNGEVLCLLEDGLWVLDIDCGGGRGSGGVDVIKVGY